MKPRGPRPLTPAQQGFGLRALFPGADLAVRRGALRWAGWLQPSPLGRRYRVRLDYRVWTPPRTRVLSPDLRELAGGRRIEHLYSQEEQELCLYLPGSGEWTPAMSLARTIVPWACEWLLHFEAWLLTGTWEGGGVHPPPRIRKQRW